MHETPQVIKEIIGGDALGLGAAARKVPAYRGDGQANPSTIWRWIVAGAKARDGTILRLESARIGGRWMTSAAAAARFFAGLTPLPGPLSAPEPIRGTNDRRQRVAAARKKLRARRVCVS